MQQQISQYITEIGKLYSQGITTEHSFRGALETLLKNMTGYQVVNEAQHIACGAPDLTLLKNNIPVGYVEAKDIGKNLKSKDYKCFCACHNHLFRMIAADDTPDCTLQKSSI